MTSQAPSGSDQKGNLIVATLALALGITCAINRSASEWLALALIFIAGIPHGSFDLRFAESRWGTSSRARALVIACYLASGLAMSALCLLWPGVGLTAFLLISVAHFAEGERIHAGRVAAVFIGVAAIFLPITLHLPEAALYLAFFVKPEHLTSVGMALELGGYGVALIVLVSIIRERSTGRGAAFLQYLMCLMSWLLLPPLAGFCVWFIGRHSRQHLERAEPFFAGSLRRLPRDFVIISLLAIGLIVPLNIWFDLRDLHQLFAASIVLIAGLTLPHMIITHGFAENR
jgi:Brp/Blh family beta-carotene 15,15'-monooxygenase